MLGFGKPKQLLDEETIVWVFDSFGWALENLGAEVFFQETELVTPSDRHFPQAVESPDEVAKQLFSQVSRLSGLSQWPWRLMTENNIPDNFSVPGLQFQGKLRGADAPAPKLLPAPVPVAGEGDMGKPEQELPESDTTGLPVSYDRKMLRDPQVLIANFAHGLAFYLGSAAGREPPGGRENWPHQTELLAVFMGFGLFMANTAYHMRISSCGSCQGSRVDRDSYLSQYDLGYALALFCQLKSIPAKSVKPYLKKSLWPFFKNAMQDVAVREKQLNLLLQFKDR